VKDGKPSSIQRSAWTDVFCAFRRFSVFPSFLQAMADPKNPRNLSNPRRSVIIVNSSIRIHEFTSVCHITGHLVLREHHGAVCGRIKICVELKSLKLYFHAYRNEGIFFEAVTNRICDDLGRTLKPRSLTIIADWKARGSFTSRITADWQPPAKKRR